MVSNLTSRIELHKCCLVFTILLFITAIVMPFNAESQTVNKGEVGLRIVSSMLDNGQCSEAKAILDTLAYDNNTAPHYFYFKGVANQMCGNDPEGKFNFETCIAEFDKYSYKDECYLDATLRLIDFYRRVDTNWDKVAILARRALEAPKDALDNYPNSYALYESCAQALNDLWKPMDVENIVASGLPYIEKSFSPEEKPYYNLRIMEIVALTLMNRWDRALSKLNELDEINKTRGNHVVDEEVASLSSTILRQRETMDWRANAEDRINRVSEIGAGLMILNPASTTEGAELWKQFLLTIFDDLELKHFDINNPQDEKYWSRLLAYAVVYFASCCNEMEGREQLAYDLMLLRKNFLDYHTGLIHKTPKRWQDVKESLSDGELAVEISMYPNEILLVGNDFKSPIAISLSENLCEAVENYSNADATVVNEFYQSESPLEEIVSLIKPYLDGIKTIYLSPANHFAQFNYSALPYENIRLGEAFQVVQMTTTADIPFYKSRTNLSEVSVSATLIGGVDYDNSPSSVVTSYPSSKEPSVYSLLRSGFGYLPYSQTEVENIAQILKGIQTRVLTGTSASEEAFYTLNNTNDQIVHIATHGYSLPASTDSTAYDSSSKIASVLSRTGLLLAGANRTLKGQVADGSDGILTSGEIAGMNLRNVRLAGLSFCSSGMGDLSNITGVVYGVSNAMKTSGVQEILVTLWDVPDEVASIAMTEFYKNFSMGLPSVDSLRIAQKALMSQGYTDPYHWASFMILD